MKHMLIATVSALAITASAGVAHAECKLPANATYSKQDRAVKSGDVRRNLRTLRRAANVLRDHGRDEACEEVVEAINEIIKNPDAEKTWVTNYSKRTGDKTVMKRYERYGDKTWQDRAKTRMQKAMPITEAKGKITADNLIGADVVGLNNDTIGEINDVIMTSDGKASYILLDFGGFLGLGQEHTAIPFEKLMVSYDEDGDPTYFLAATEDMLEKAPRFKRGDRNWISDDKWMKENRAYYDKHVKANTDMKSDKDMKKAK